MRKDGGVGRGQSLENGEKRAGRSLSDGRRRREGGPLVMVIGQVGGRVGTGPRSPGSPGRGSALCTTRIVMALPHSSPNMANNEPSGTCH